MRKSKMFNEMQLYTGWSLPLGQPREEPTDEFYEEPCEIDEDPGGQSEKQDG